MAVLDSFHDFYPRARKERNLAFARAQRGFAGVFEGDIRDADFVAKTFASFAPRQVVHLAARAGVRPSLEDPVTYADVNLVGTSVVLNAALRGAVERFVFASSSSVYGERPRGEFTEDLAADRPLSPYGATKRGGELLCHAAHASSGMPTSCLRFFNAYGPRMRPDLAIHKFAVLMLADQPIPVFGDGSFERDFTFVSDTVDGIVRALDRAQAFHVYNLGRGKPVTVNEIIASLERVLGRRARRQTLPPTAGRSAANLGLDRARRRRARLRAAGGSRRGRRALRRAGCARRARVGDLRDTALGARVIRIVPLRGASWRSCTWLAWFRSRRSPGGGSSRWGLSAYTLDLMHIPLFAGLALVTMWAVVAPRARRVVWISIGLTLYAALDEILQLWVPGRVASFADFARDALGIAIGIALAEAARPLAVALRRESER